MDYRFTIRFGKQPCPEYQTVLVYASKFRMFLPAPEGTSIHRIETDNHEALEKYEVFTKLMDIICSWDSTRFIHDDQEFAPVEFMLAEKRQVAACHARYLNADARENYCDVKNPSCWGCRMLDGIVLRHEKTAFSEGLKYWYQFGTFTDAKTWRINREELIKALENIVKRQNLQFCPIFEYTFYRRYVAALPQLIHLPDPRNWETVYRTDSQTSAKRWEAISIMHVSTAAGVRDISDAEGDASGAKLKDENATDYKYLRKVPVTTFADIGGVDDIIHNIRVMIELPLKKPRLFEQLGVKPYRGILL